MTPILGNKIDSYTDVNSLPAEHWVLSEWKAKKSVSNATLYLYIPSVLGSGNFKIRIYDGSGNAIRATQICAILGVGINKFTLSNVTLTKDATYRVVTTSDGYNVGARLGTDSYTYPSAGYDFATLSKRSFDGYADGLPATIDPSGMADLTYLRHNFTITDEDVDVVSTTIWVGDSHSSRVDLFNPQQWLTDIFNTGNRGLHYSLPKGTGGRTTAEILSNLAADVGSLSVVGEKRAYVTGGSNDIALGTPPTAQQIYDNLVDIWEYLMGLGYHVTAFTIPLRIGVSDTLRNAANVLIKSDTTKYDQLFDWDAIYESSHYPEYTKYYYGDVHVSQYGSCITEVKRNEDIGNPRFGLLFGGSMYPTSTNRSKLVNGRVYYGRFLNRYARTVTHLGACVFNEGNCKIALFSDNSDAVGTLLRSSSESLLTFGRNFVSVTPYNLSADTYYWIGVISDTDQSVQDRQREEADTDAYNKYAYKTATYSGFSFASDPTGLTAVPNKTLEVFAIGMASPEITDCTDPITDGDPATITGQYFSASGNTLRFGNASTLSACTVLSTATITAESTVEITGTVDATGLDAGTVYAYVTNADGLTNEAGVGTELESGSVDCTIDETITVNNSFPTTVGRLSTDVGGAIGVTNSFNTAVGRLSTIEETIVVNNSFLTTVGRLTVDMGGTIVVNGGFVYATRRGFNNGTMARLWRRR